MDWNTTDLLLKALYAVLVFGAGYMIAGWLTGVVNMALERSKLDPIVRRLIVSAVRPVVVAIAVFAALAVIGIPMTTFAAIAGAATLAVGMALRGTLSNVASGAMLLSLRPFNADDYIEAGGMKGTVRALRLFCTVLETPDGNTVTLPNDKVFSGPITTYTTTPHSRVDLTWVVGAQTSLDAIEKKVLAAMKDDERVLEEPAPRVVFGDTNELGLAVTGRFWTVNDDKWDAKSDVQRAVLESFKKARPKIELATRAT